MSSETNPEPLRTMLRIHRGRLNAIEQADLHSIIIEEPEATPPDPWQEILDDLHCRERCIPDFLPLPPRLMGKPRLECERLMDGPVKRELVYLGADEHLIAYRRIATDLAEVLSNHHDKIFGGRQRVAGFYKSSEPMGDNIFTIYWGAAGGGTWVGHAWTIAVHCLLDLEDPRALIGRYAWSTEPYHDDLPIDREGEYERFAETQFDIGAGRDRIVAIHALRNDLVLSSILAIDAILRALEPSLAGSVRAASSERWIPQAEACRRFGINESAMSKAIKKGLVMQRKAQKPSGKCRNEVELGSVCAFVDSTNKGPPPRRLRHVPLTRVSKFL